MPINRQRNVESEFLVSSMFNPLQTSSVLADNLNKINRKSQLWSVFFILNKQSHYPSKKDKSVYRLRFKSWPVTGHRFPPVLKVLSDK